MSISLRGKPPRRETFSQPAENKAQNHPVIDRLAVDRETKRAIVRCVLELGKSLKYTQAATRINGRVLPQDVILNVVLEHIQDQQQAEMERVRLEAARQVDSYRRAYVAELRKTA